MAYPENPLRTLWKIAAKTVTLANHNRDTLGYITLAAANAAFYVKTGVIIPEYIVFPLFFREFGRSSAWHMKITKNVFAKSQSAPVNCNRFSLVAVLGAGAAITAFATLSITPFTFALAGLCLMTAHRVGGVRAAYNDYKLMWNWPKHFDREEDRDRGGGGGDGDPRQEDPLKNDAPPLILVPRPRLVAQNASILKLAA